MDALIVALLYFLLNMCLCVFGWFYLHGEVPSRFKYFLVMILFGVPLVFLLFLVGTGVRMMVMANAKHKDTG